jgi:UDP-glucose:(heptosyl)LPS alpha-1,3-glucosyltransferase
MKLAFCLFNYFPYGGLQRDFVRIAKECVRRGHTVDVYTMRWEGEQYSELSINIITVQGWQNHIRSQQFVSAVQKALAKQHYDQVVGFNKMPGLDVYYAADTCFQAKARAKHGAWYRWLPRYRHLMTYEKAVFAAEAKTKILLIAKAQQAEFMHYYGTKAQRFFLLPPGIAKDRIAPTNAAEIRAAVRHEWQIKANDFLLLLVGSGFKTKGLDRILQGIAALPDSLKQRTQLFVIGKDHAEIFQQQASQLKITQYVKFLGGRDDVAKFLLAADLLLHPAYNENTGTVLLEALVAGLPALTTDVCGYAHYVADAHAGVVLPSPFQQTQFNQVLQDMLLSAQRTVWQQNGLAFAKQADIYSMSERAVDIIESINANT